MEPGTWNMEHGTRNSELRTFFKEKEYLIYANGIQYKNQYSPYCAT